MLRNIWFVGSIICGIFCLGWQASAADLGFRYKDGRCLNNAGQTGLNPSYFGQCADLRRVVIARLDFTGVDFSGSNFSASDLQETSFRKANLTGCNFSDSNLAGTDMTQAQLIGVTFKGANLKRVSFSEAMIANADFSGVDLQKATLSYLDAKRSNFRGANLTDAQLDFADLSGSDFTSAKLVRANLGKANLRSSILNEAAMLEANLSGAFLDAGTATKTDFSGAKLNQASLVKASATGAIFKRASLANANLNGADLQDTTFVIANLSGATLDGAKLERAVFNKKTVLPFDVETAKRLGMSLRNLTTVLVLWDRDDAYLNDFLNALSDDLEFVKSKKVEGEFDGSELNSGIDVVLHFNAAIDVPHPMAEAGQKVILDFVKGGGRFVYSSFNDYQLDNNQLQTMSELILCTHRYSSGPIRYKLTPVGSADPLTFGLEQIFDITGSVSIGAVRTFSASSVNISIATSDGLPLVVWRQVEKGMSIGVKFACTYSAEKCLNDKNVRQIYRNALSM